MIYPLLMAEQFRSVNYYNLPRHDSFCRKVRRNPEDLSFAEKKTDVAAVDLPDFIWRFLMGIGIEPTTRPGFYKQT